jgi:heme-degrading monooxygenase HmoA
MTPHSGFYSIVDYLFPKAEDPGEVAAAFAQVQSDWVASYPGYVSARFLANTEGSLVRAIIQWESEETFRAFETESDSKGRMAALEGAFRKFSAQGSRRTFRAIGEVLPNGFGESAA